VKPYGTPRPWPPDMDQELMHVLREQRSRGWGNTKPPEDPGLTTVMDELDAWLNDPRPYDGQHRRAWDSMTAEVKRSLLSRGDLLQSASPALTVLHEQLGLPNLGGNAAARDRCRDLLGRGRQELARSDAAVAAFNDLVNAVQDPATPGAVIADRIAVLDATLEAGDRSLAAEASRLAEIIDDGAFEIHFAKHQLDGTPIDQPPDIRAEAGLTLDARLELCRRLLAQPRNQGRDVVWFGYDRARIRVHWFLEMGPVTFFEGPALLGALESLAEDRQRYERHFAGVLPEELLSEKNESRASLWLKPDRVKDDSDWVVVRVDLGAASYADPIAVAQQQADALVKLAGFHSGRTSWRRLEGYAHLVDGRARQWNAFAPPIDHEAWIDRTGDVLDELSADLVGHLPVNDGRLLELLEAAAVVQSHSDDDADPTTLLNDVRIIEMLASRCTSEWRNHLKTTFAIDWARREVVDEIYGAVAGLTEYAEVRRLDSMPEPGSFLESVPDEPERVWVRYDLALAAVPALARDLPAHVPGARRVRALAARTSTPQRLDRWVDELVTDYGRRVERLSRCRNSLAHGGPVNLQVAATVKRFANRQAARTTSMGLWAVVRGASVADAHAQHRARAENWKNNIRSAENALDALDLPSRSPADPVTGTDAT